MRLFDNGTAGLRTALGGLAQDVDMLRDNQERIQESVRSGVGLGGLAREDVGWRKVSGGADDNDAIPLDVLQEHAERARKLRALNPLVKRGIVVRNAYIWQHDIKYPTGAEKIIDDPTNQDQVFGDSTQEELEATLTTDGQYFLLCDPARKTVHKVPFDEITGTVRNPDHEGEIWYYRRTFTRNTTDYDTGVTQPEVQNVWFPAITHEGPYEKTILKQPVDDSKRVEHARVNTITGSGFGVPDLIGAVYWAAAYKEYLEASYTLAKALARLAFKVSNQSSKGTKAVAAKLAGPVNKNEAGSTVALGAGQDLQAINKSGSGIDFAAGTPLAAMVAAALDIPLSVVLTDGSAGGRQGAEAALEDPTIKTMNLRRKVHLASRARVLRLFGVAGKSVWPPLNGDLVHRRIQSIQVAIDSGLLHAEEARGEILRTLAVPTEREDDDIPEEYEKKQEQPATVPANGPGPMSDGTNDSRDNPGGATEA